MGPNESVQSQAAAAADFDQHEHRGDGARIASSLYDGLNTLRNLFYTRAYSDVVNVFGTDSIMVPVSATQTEAKAKAEIDLYLIVESAAEARSTNLVGDGDDWYLHWLARLRLGEAAEAAIAPRLLQMAAKGPDERRRSFSVVLERTLPEASRAPLIVYRLLPLAAAIVTSMAFGDANRAAETRKRQRALLPGIGDCQQCRGNLLENGEKCQQCGNPFWKYQWLTAE
jgi:hypothetical protein